MFVSFFFLLLFIFEVGFDGFVFGVLVFLFCFCCMIFFGRIVGGGVLFVEMVVLLIIDDKDGGIW